MPRALPLGRRAADMEQEREKKLHVFFRIDLIDLIYNWAMLDFLYCGKIGIT